MAMDYAQLFGSLGHVIGTLNAANTYRGTTLTSRLSTLFSDAAGRISFSTPPTGTTVDFGGETTSAREAINGWVSFLTTLATQWIDTELDVDVPMTSTDLESRIAELSRRMVADGETLNDSPCTATVASIGSPTGDPVLVVARHEYTGRVSDYLVPDVYTILCTADRSTGGTAYAETFSFVGKPADSLPTDASYPSGTSINTTLTLIDPSQDFGVLEDGVFNDVTAGAFDEWSLGTGTVFNTNVFRVADAPRIGASGFALRFLGDGSNVLKLRQEVTDDVTATGVYTAHFRLKKVTDPGTDWAVSMRLVDGSGTAVAGPASYSNVISSLAASSVTADWENVVSGTFVIPAVIPSTGLFVEVLFHQSGSLTTAAANTADAYVSFVALHATTPLYAGGLAVNGYSGLDESVVGDGKTITVALSAGDIDDFIIRGLDRLLGLASLTARLPTVSGGGETISDALIV